MEKIKDLSPLERPREKLVEHGVRILRDDELLAILLASGTPKYPLHEICGNLIKHDLATIARMDLKVQSDIVEL